MSHHTLLPVHFYIHVAPTRHEKWLAVPVSTHGQPHQHIGLKFLLNVKLDSWWCVFLAPRVLTIVSWNLVTLPRKLGLVHHHFNSVTMTALPQFARASGIIFFSFFLLRSPLRGFLPFVVLHPFILRHLLNIRLADVELPGKFHQAHPPLSWAALLRRLLPARGSLTAGLPDPGALSVLLSS